MAAGCMESLFADGTTIMAYNLNKTETTRTHTHTHAQKHVRNAEPP